MSTFPLFKNKISFSDFQKTAKISHDIKYQTETLSTTFSQTDSRTFSGNII